MNAINDATLGAATLEHPYWRRNLLVCVVGSFTTIVAMTLLLPFLPLYVAQLGVTDQAAIVQWSGVAYGATFFTAALVAPLWGRLADIYGRKLMMMRASLGMAIAMSLIGMAHNAWDLVAFRLLAGFVGGYASGSTVLVASQTPKGRSGWALGTLATGIMAGNLVGPLIGGALPPLVGIRGTFWLAGGVIFLSFIATSCFIKEDRRAQKRCQKSGARAGLSAIAKSGPIRAMLATSSLLMLSTMSIEPIITVYVSQLVADQSRVSVVSGIVMSACALGSVLSASRIGTLADRVGHWKVLIAGLAAAAILLIPQAFVTHAWQLVGLRFLMGIALGGLLPCITSVIRHNAPDTITGTVIGYSTSAQYVGQVIGPLAGGFIGGHFGMRPVFIATCVALAGGAFYNWFTFVANQRPARN